MIQYGGKAESIVFNAKLNNHRKDRKKLDSILLCKHFQQQEHNLINTTQKIKLSIKDFFSKCNQIHRKLRIW